MPKSKIRIKLCFGEMATQNESSFMRNDLADTCALLREADRRGLQLPLNVGLGRDLSIRDLAEPVAAIVGYSGAIESDVNRPDGAPRKLLDSGGLHATGRDTRIGLQAGVIDTYAWYQKNVKTAEAAS